ncbi:ATP-binding cassette domain-containing protein [Streptomyces sp. HSW2009]|uniref:ABC transporter ATP-binding protein n=1 Tax=Streptomyces sp. HSW2009 TaxID=3142890 RepID=UPI0032EEC3B8
MTETGAGTGATAGAALLRLVGVGRRYGEQTVLRSVTLDVAPGECVALVGDNGSGKSTLLRLAGGRERPSTGTVEFAGAPVGADEARTRSRIAAVLDTGAHYPDLTVYEHLMLVALAHGARVAAAEETVAAELAAYRLTDRADVLPAALSSGQTQALALAAAFVRPHELLVLDEPEQRLDAQARRALAARLAAHRDAGTAVLLATHHEGLRAIADRVLVFDGAGAAAEPAAGEGGR